MYRVECDVYYVQHDKNFEVAKCKKEFIGKDQTDVYGYIKYYCLKWGMVDVKMLDEGEYNEK